MQSPLCLAHFQRPQPYARYCDNTALPGSDFCSEHLTSRPYCAVRCCPYCRAEDSLFCSEHGAVMATRPA